MQKSMNPVRRLNDSSKQGRPLRSLGSSKDHFSKAHGPCFLRYRKTIGFLFEIIVALASLAVFIKLSLAMFVDMDSGMEMISERPYVALLLIVTGSLATFNLSRLTQTAQRLTGRAS